MVVCPAGLIPLFLGLLLCLSAALEGWSRPLRLGGEVLLTANWDGKRSVSRKRAGLTSCVQSASVGKYDIGLAQPGLPGGAFGVSPQGPGKEVEGRPASRRTSPLGARV